MTNLLSKKNKIESDLAKRLGDIVIDQEVAIKTIVPYVEAHRSGLAPEGRPAGVFLLLGPTGTGKTRTVEALAEVLHGSPKNVLRIDCGEFSHEHEVAKLIGAPPGYLGHRETTPLLNQAKVNAVASGSSTISLILFDEIEKAAVSLTRLLLGILDKATLRLGDNNTVNFENCLIFMTSNLGAKTLAKQINPDFGFEKYTAGGPEARLDAKSIQSIGMAAVKAKYAPEFVNRIDEVVTYTPLSKQAFSVIFEQLVRQHARLLFSRLGSRAFRIAYTPAGRNHIVKIGTSVEYGARELKRTFQREFTAPLASLVAQNQIPPGSTVVLHAVLGKVQILLDENLDQQRRAA